jgi:hypothetical protein
MDTHEDAEYTGFGHPNSSHPSRRVVSAHDDDALTFYFDRVLIKIIYAKNREINLR